MSMVRTARMIVTLSQVFVVQLLLGMLLLYQRGNVVESAQDSQKVAFLLIPGSPQYPLEPWEVDFLRRYLPYSLDDDTPNMMMMPTATTTRKMTPTMEYREKEYREGFQRLKQFHATIDTDHQNNDTSHHFHPNSSSGGGIVSSSRSHYHYLPSLENPFFFFHIPKTGGSSLREFLFTDFLVNIFPPQPLAMPVNTSKCVMRPSLPPHPPSVQRGHIKFPPSTVSTTVGSATSDAGISSSPQLSESENTRTTWDLRIDSSFDINRASSASLGSSSTQNEELSSVEMEERRRLSQIPPPPLPRPLLVRNQVRASTIKPKFKDRQHKPFCKRKGSMYRPLYNPRSNVLVPCYNCNCTCDVLAITNQTSCASAFIGHFFPFEIFSHLHHIRSGIYGTPECTRWNDLPSTSVDAYYSTLRQDNHQFLKASDRLFWDSLDKSLCATVLRNPFSRAISGYYEFGFPITNITATEYLKTYGIKEFMDISSSYFNGQTSILGGEIDVNNSTLALSHAKHVMEHCIVGVQEEFSEFISALSELFSIPKSIQTKLQHKNSSEKKLASMTSTRLEMNMTWFHELASPFVSLDLELWQYAQYVAKRQKQLLSFAEIVKVSVDSGQKLKVVYKSNV